MFGEGALGGSLPIYWLIRNLVAVHTPDEL